MKGVDIRKLIETVPILEFHFDGIFARDSLISLHKQQHFAIINVDKQNQEGSHWIYCARSNETLEYFNPLGESTHAKSQLILSNSNLLKGIADVVISENQYQPSGSENCGLFCIYVAYHRLHRLNQPFSHVLSKIFSDDPSNNDATVTSFARSVLSYTTT